MTAPPEGGARRAPPAAGDLAAAPCAAVLKARFAEELAQLARDMSTFQTTLSTLLEHGRMSPAQLRSLQDLDRATQMLDNLHRVAGALAAAHPDPVPTSELERLITLNDLKRRLAGDTPGPIEVSDDGISWF